MLQIMSYDYAEVNTVLRYYNDTLNSQQTAFDYDKLQGLMVSARHRPQCAAKV